MSDVNASTATISPETTRLPLQARPSAGLFSARESLDGGVACPRGARYLDTAPGPVFI